MNSPTMRAIMRLMTERNLAVQSAEDSAANFRASEVKRIEAERERDEAKAKRVGMVCEVCWTSSHEPCSETDEGAVAYKDGSGFVSCSMCRTTEELKKALAERDEARRHLADARFAHAADIEERDQLRKVCDELASACDDFSPCKGYSSTQFTVALKAYNSLPHVKEKGQR